MNKISECRNIREDRVRTLGRRIPRVKIPFKIYDYYDEEWIESDINVISLNHLVNHAYYHTICPNDIGQKISKVSKRHKIAFPFTHYVKYTNRQTLELMTKKISEKLGDCYK